MQTVLPKVVFGVRNNGCPERETEDETKAEVSGRVPSPASVPSFAKAGTESMKNHLMKFHPQPVEVSHSTQPSIMHSLQTFVHKGNENQVKAALVFCMNPYMTFRLASDPFFIQAYDHPIRTSRSFVAPSPGSFFVLLQLIHCCLTVLHLFRIIMFILAYMFGTDSGSRRTPKQKQNITY